MKYYLLVNNLIIYIGLLAVQFGSVADGIRTVGNRRIREYTRIGYPELAGAYE